MSITNCCPIKSTTNRLSKHTIILNRQVLNHIQEGKTGVAMCPEWHYGVCSMYGTHLALNHLIGENAINLVPLPKLVDFPTVNEDSVYSKLHLHVLHGYQMFSTFEFKKGTYSNVTATNRPSWLSILL